MSGNFRNLLLWQPCLTCTCSHACDVHHYSECSVPVEYDHCKLSGLSPRFFIKLYLDEASSNRGQTGAKFVSVISTLFQCMKVNAHENKFSNGSFHRNDGQA